MSIEQYQDFHQVRRLLKVIAPEFDIFATPEIPVGSVCYDLRKKSLEIGEGTEMMQAVGALLHSIGHLILRYHPDYGLFFGRGLRDWEGTDEELITLLSTLGERADQFSRGWATQVFKAYWQQHEDQADAIIDRYCMGHDEWHSYWSEKNFH